MASSEPQSTLLQTAHKIMSSYDTWDIDTILAPRHSTCTQQVLPTRLQRPAHTNSGYREAFEQNIKPHFKNFHMEILDTIEDPQRHKVVFHAKSTAETPVGPYANEYTIIMQMTDDDKEVLSIKEFVDSAYGAEFFPKLQKHLATSS